MALLLYPPLYAMAFTGGYQRTGTGGLANRTAAWCQPPVQRNFFYKYSFQKIYGKEENACYRGFRKPGQVQLPGGTKIKCPPTAGDSPWASQRHDRQHGNRNRKKSFRRCWYGHFIPQSLAPERIL